MFVGKMEISEEFAADLLERIRRGATKTFQRYLADTAIDHATRDLRDGKPRKAPDLAVEGDRPDQEPPF